MVQLHIVIYIPVTYSQPQFIKHNFLFKKVNFVIKDGGIQL